ncbi:MAG: FMN-binding protein [Mycobacteriaceae bacterium]
MRRIVLTFASTAAALVLLFSYRTSTGSGDVAAKAIVAGSAGVVSGGGSPIGTASSSGSAPPSGSPTVSAGAAPAATSRVINGSTVQTRFGPVQVQITVSAGKVTAADAVQYPTRDRRDVAISSQAIPILDSEVLSAQSANIDAVSGASYTSDGYVQSLQSALDLAHQ